MARFPLPPSEVRNANLAVRLRQSLLVELDATVVGHTCNRSELVIALLEQALAAGLAPAALDQIERSKVRKLTTLSRDEVLKRLQEVENDRTLLSAALSAMSDKAAVSS